MDGNPPLKRAWSGHMTHLIFRALTISITAEARVVKFDVPVGYIKRQRKDDKLPNNGHGQCHDHLFKFGESIISLKLAF